MTNLQRKLAPLAAAAAAVVFSVSAADAELKVTKTSDSIVDANAMLFPVGSPYGRAINGQQFQQSALLSHNGYQYTAWYRKDQAPGTDESVMLARRTISGATVGAWEVYDTGWNLINGDANEGWDVHNTISIGISKNDGRLHIAWDHHLHNLRYSVSQPGLLNGTVTWGAGMMGSESQSLSGNRLFGITYPMFFNTPTGDLQFAYRTGSSNNGVFNIATYADPENDGTYSWDLPKPIIGPTGTYQISPGNNSTSRNGYPNGFTYGPDGTLHTTWVWRENGPYPNHDLNYAYSTDGGVTWYNNAGQKVADATTNDMILISDPGLVVHSIDLKQSLYNQQTQTVDQQGGVHTVIVYRRQEPGYEYRSSHQQWDPERVAYYHHYRDPSSGEWSVHRLPVETGVGARPAIGVDANGNIYAVYTDRGPEDGDYKYNAGSLVIAGASAASGYSDWSILHIEDVEFIGEPQLDTERLLNDGILSIFIQEDSPVTGATTSNLHVIEFAVPEPGTALAMAGGLALMALRPRRRMA